MTAPWVSASEYVASWVPAEYLPARPEDLASVWRERALILSEQVVRIEEQNETLRQALHDVIYTPAGYESKLAWDRAIALVSNPASATQAHDGEEAGVSPSGGHDGIASRPGSAETSNPAKGRE